MELYVLILWPALISTKHGLVQFLYLSIRIRYIRGKQDYGKRYNPCPKVLVKARFEPIERPHLNTAIPPNLLNNSITTFRPGLKLKTEIQQIMENQK